MSEKPRWSADKKRRVATMKQQIGSAPDEALDIIEAVFAGEHHKAIMLMVNMAGPFLTREELEERIDEDKPCPTCGGTGSVLCQVELDGSKTYGGCPDCKEE